MSGCVHSPTPLLASYAQEAAGVWGSVAGHSHQSWRLLESRSWGGGRARDGPTTPPSTTPGRAPDQTRPPAAPPPAVPLRQAAHAPTSSGPGRPARRSTVEGRRQGGPARRAGAGRGGPWSLGDLPDAQKPMRDPVEPRVSVAIDAEPAHGEGEDGFLGGQAAAPSAERSRSPRGPRRPLVRNGRGIRRGCIRPLARRAAEEPCRGRTGNPATGAPHA